MPVRINLLAEAQALEDMRRRDPVKRAIWVGALLGVLLLLYSGYLQSKAVVAQTEVRHMENQLQSNTNQYQQVLEHKRRLDDAIQKLAKLQELSANRFTEATLLDALQHSTVDDVQLTRLKVENEYVVVEETKPKKDSDGVVLAKGKPATNTEKIKVTIEAKDNSDGEQTIKFQAAMAESPYFQMVLGRNNEFKMVSHQQLATTEGGKKSAQFTLEGRIPEKTR